ncbi:MAG: hypothetical protein ABI873_13930 [Marmoricola sp.]
MPVVDVEVVGEPPEVAQQLADALGTVFATGAGRTWVRLRALPVSHYAENDTAVGGEELPCFVTVLHSSVPQGAALDRELAAVTASVADVLGRDRARVHVEYSPPATGRQAFGGRLVR